MFDSPRTSTSPSSASLISIPGSGGPTVPIFTSSGGLQVATPQVSDIPHSSPIGIPIAWKNSSTSTGVGAAPTLTATTSSSPSLARSENIAASAWATPPPAPPGTSSPACSRRTFWIAASRPFCAGSRCSSGIEAIFASSPAFSFSQIRGTAKNQVGLTRAGTR